MKLNFNTEKLVLTLGAITLILFSTKPYILDLIEPSKSIGKIIGENAKDLIDSLNGESKNQNKHLSKRETWSNIITILAFILFVLTTALSVISIRKKSKNLYAIAAIALSAIGLIIYISQLAIGLIGFIVIATLVVIVVLAEGT